MSWVPTQSRAPRDAFGSVIGILVFLGGVALLLFTFRLAYDMFTVPPADALGIKAGQEIDGAAVGNRLTTIILRVILLLVMGVMGSLVANRGIALYSQSRGVPLPSNRGKKPTSESSPVENKESSEAGG